MRSSYVFLLLAFQEMHASGGCFFSQDPIDRAGAVTLDRSLAGSWQCDTLTSPDAEVKSSDAIPFVVSVGDREHYVIDAPTAAVTSYKRMRAHPSTIGTRAFLNLELTHAGGARDFFFAQYRLVTPKRVALQIVVDDLILSRESTRQLFERLAGDEAFYDTDVLTCDKQ